MEPAILAAIITGGTTVLAAIIAEIVSFIKKKKSNDKSIEIKQTQEGDNNIQIGIQNNYDGGEKKWIK